MISKLIPAVTAVIAPTVANNGAIGKAAAEALATPAAVDTASVLLIKGFNFDNPVIILPIPVVIPPSSL